MNETPFFSIVVPAHNEEQYIDQTLEHLVALSYPKERYEVIVVENGSTDRTLERARVFARENVRILSFPQKGVAFARNRGLEAVRPTCDWVIFLDADTHMNQEHLSRLSRYLQSLKSTSVIGTTSVAPNPCTLYARIWFFFYNLSHRFLQQPFASIIVRRSAVDGLLFDEELAWMEDEKFVRMMRTRGTFFFMNTNTLSTSIRRFMHDGWFRNLILNIGVGILPSTLQKRFAYVPVR